MKNFIVRTSNSFRFTSDNANDTAEIFTAFVDGYENGYIIIDSSNQVYILSIPKVEQLLSEGIFKVVGE